MSLYLECWECRKPIEGTQTFDPRFGVAPFVAQGIVARCGAAVLHPAGDCYVRYVSGRSAEVREELPGAAGDPGCGEPVACLEG